MNPEQENIIGIVGGMGPQAGLALYDKIIRHTKAVRDQQHLSVVMMSFSKHIVDRTEFLQGDTYTNPAFSIAVVIKKLEHAGAEIVGIPCNTSHSSPILDVIYRELDRMDCRVRLVNMPVETCHFIQANHKSVRRIGVMTTNGTYKTGLYKNLLLDLGYDVVIPDLIFQNEVIHRMIYDPVFGIKSKPDSISLEVKMLLEKALNFFKKRNADAIILGCTELSLILPGMMVNDMLVIDSTDVLAKALIREATKREQFPHAKSLKNIKS